MFISSEELKNKFFDFEIIGVNPDVQDAMFGTCHPDECCEDDFVMCWMRVLDKFGIDYFTRSQHESTDNKI